MRRAIGRQPVRWVHPGQPVVSRWRRRRSVVLVKLVSATHSLQNHLARRGCCPEPPLPLLPQLIGAAAARPTRAQVTACDTRCPDHQAYRRVRPACCVPPRHSVTLPAALTTKRAGACAPVACRLAPQRIHRRGWPTPRRRTWPFFFLISALFPSLASGTFASLPLVVAKK